MEMKVNYKWSHAKNVVYVLFETKWEVIFKFRFRRSEMKREGLCDARDEYAKH